MCACRGEGGSIPGHSHMRARPSVALSRSTITPRPRARAETDMFHVKHRMQVGAITTRGVPIQRENAALRSAALLPRLLGSGFPSRAHAGERSAQHLVDSHCGENAWRREVWLHALPGAARSAHHHVTDQRTTEIPLNGNPLSALRSPSALASAHRRRPRRPRGSPHRRPRTGGSASLPRRPQRRHSRPSDTPGARPHEPTGRSTE